MNSSDRFYLFVLGGVAIIIALMAIGFWDYEVKRTVLDQKIAIMCVEQGGTPLNINGTMSCLHKISRIA